MSQPRVRKGAGGDGAGRGRGPAPRVSAPAAIPNTSRPREPSQLSRSKTNVPKTLRYDLENALVGLCDVWFEEIKPHLVRNKIKLHVHEGGTGASASGDHAPNNPGCSHLDPGAASDHLPRRDASCADCCSMQPTASKAQYHRPQQPSRKHLSLSSTLESQNQLHNYEKKSPKHPRIRRRQQTAKVQSPESRWRVPRLCRTDTVVTSPRPALWSASNRIPYQEPCLSASGPYDACHFQFPMSRIKVKMYNKATETNPQPKRHLVSVGCQTSPSVLNLRCIRRPTAPTARRQRPLSPVQLESSLRRESPITRSRCSSPEKTSLRRRQSSETRSHASPVTRRTKSPSKSPARPVLKPKLAEQTTKSHNEVVPDAKCCETAPPDIPVPPWHRADRFGRTPATTTFFPSRRKSERRKPTVIDQEPVLFEDDLVNTIGEKNDKSIKVLFKKSESTERPSSLNLLPTPRDLAGTDGWLNKRPWK